MTESTARPTARATSTAATSTAAASAAGIARLLLIGLVSIASLLLLMVQLHSRWESDRFPLHFPDFMVFWAVGPTMKHGGLAELFDMAAFTARQNLLYRELLDTPLVVRPWLYPPSFLAIAGTFAIVPFLISAFLVQAGGAAMLWLTLGRRTIRWLVVLASPAFGATLLPGQLSAWIAAGIIGGLLLMETHAVLAGIVLGLVSIKPHLFALVPVALVAARAWRTLAAALTTALGLVISSLLLYGWTPWALWIGGATGATQVVAEHYATYAATMGSVLDSIRALGGSGTTAWLGQMVAAILAVAAVWHVYRSTTARAPRLLVVASASLLLTPYWLNYDLLLPTLAMAVVAEDRADAAEVPGEKVVWLLVWMLPYAMPLSRGLYGLPIGALVMVALMLVTLRRHQMEQRVAPAMVREHL